MELNLKTDSPLEICATSRVSLLKGEHFSNARERSKKCFSGRRKCKVSVLDGRRKAEERRGEERRVRGGIYTRRVATRGARGAAPLLCK